MDVKIIGTPFVLNTVDVVIKVDMRVGNSTDSAIPPIVLDGRVCSSFEGHTGPLYECLFTRLGILDKYQIWL